MCFAEAERRRRNYHRGRQELIEQMGSTCSACGAAEGEIGWDGKEVKIEFHHKGPRDWIPKDTARWVRLARYRREWQAGKLDLLCAACNKKLGKPTRKNLTRFREFCRARWQAAAKGINGNLVASA